MKLTDEQIMIQDMARKFAREELLPGAAERDHTCEFPRAQIDEMGKLGLMGMLVPAEWDGAGTDHVSMVLAIEEVAYADGAVSTVMSVQNSLVEAGILRFGTDEQKEIFLKPLARGEKLGCFGLTEPQAGSDPAALLTSAKKDGDNYILNGTKQFITSGKEGDLALIFAVTDPDAGKKGMSCFIVETDREGYVVANIEKKMGQRCSDTAQLVFEDMVIPASNMLGEEGEGYVVALSNLEGGRIGIASQSVGMAMAAYDLAVDYAKERETFGKPIIKHQAIAFRLAEMATQIEAAHLMTLNAARMRDEGLPCLKEACMAKLFASEMTLKVISDAIQVFGGYGYVEDFPLERIYRDARVCTIYEGTSDIQKNCY